MLCLQLGDDSAHTPPYFRSENLILHLLRKWLAHLLHAKVNLFIHVGFHESNVIFFFFFYDSCHFRYLFCVTFYRFIRVYHVYPSQRALNKSKSITSIYHFSLVNFVRNDVAVAMLMVQQTEEKINIILESY